MNDLMKRQRHFLEGRTTVSNEIIPSNSVPHGSDRQRGYKTARTKALWRLAQAAVNKPGEALSSTSVTYDRRRDAVVDASRIRRGRQGTVNNAVKALGAVGMIEAWAEEHHFGHTLGMRFLPHRPTGRTDATYEVPTRPTHEARETANL